MKRRTLIASIGAVAGTTLGAAAYSSATVTRDATISVTTDDNALIQLTAGSFDQITQDGTTGALTIDFSQLNGNSEFTFGDADDPSTTNAFSLMQNEPERDVTLDYTLDGNDPDAETENLQFEIFSGNSTDGTVTLEATATEGDEAGGNTFTATPETEYYVVLTINTAGVDDSSTTDLSGELTIST